MVQKPNSSKSKPKTKNSQVTIAGSSVQPQNPSQPAQQENPEQRKNKETTCEPMHAENQETRLAQEECEEGEINQEQGKIETSDSPSPKETFSSPPSSPHPQKDLNSSPSYVDMTKRKPPELSISSEDILFERSSKKQGRKSNKEIREEEAEKQKMQGSQATIESSINKGTRNRNNRAGSSGQAGGK